MQVVHRKNPTKYGLTAAENVDCSQKKTKKYKSTGADYVGCP